MDRGSQTNEDLLRARGIEPQPLQPEPPVNVQAQFEAADVLGAAEPPDEPDEDAHAGPAEPPAVVEEELHEPAVDDEHMFPDSIDGCPLVRDQHAGYVRLLITCPLCHTAHKGRLPCRKYRSVGESQTAQCGRMEVVAYLLAWARSGHQFASRDAHVRHTPANAAVLAVAREKGWLAQ